MHSIKKVRTTAEQAARMKASEAIKIKEYNDLIDVCRQWRSEKKYDQESFDLTTDILIKNSESYTIWNYRRDIMINGLFKDANQEQIQTLLSQDLRFLEDRLRQFPKVYWIWNHRRWCLESAVYPDWKRELGLVSKMLEYDPRNFMGWHYRRYVIANLELSTGTPMTDEEFKYTTSKINSNFSNFSAWHNRSKLIPRMLDQQEDFDRQGFMKDELNYVRQAIYTDPDDQSSWLYQQWLLISDEILSRTSDLETLIQFVQDEILSISELQEIEPDNKWCLQSLIKYQIHLYDLLGKEIDECVVNDVKAKLVKLQEIDPVRKNRYKAIQSTLA